MRHFTAVPILPALALLCGCGGGEGSSGPPAAATPFADVTASITLPTALSQGQTVVDAPFSFGNTGTLSASGVTYAVQLTSGLNEVRIDISHAGAAARYDPATGRITFTGLPDALAAGARVTGTVHFLMAPDRSVQASAAITTTSNEGSNTAPDSTNASTAAIRYDTPIVITRGGTYSGNWRSDNPSVPAVRIDTTEAVTIDGANIMSSGDAISGPDGDYRLTVRNVNALGIQPPAAGAHKGMFVNAGNFATLTVEHNHVDHYTQGVRALTFGARLNRTGQKVTVRYNIFKNVDGRLGDGTGGYMRQPSTIFGQAIGLNHLRAADVDIGWNQIVNTPFESHSEDLISTFESSGTAADPIDIHDNYIEGDLPTDPTIAYGFTGCAIQIGDAPEKDDVGFTNVHDNQVTVIANCGISISAGHDQHIYRNRVISARNAPGDVPINTLYRAAYGLWDFYNGPDLSQPVIPGPFWYNNSVYDNVQNVVDREGKAANNLIVNGDANTRNNVNPFERLATLQDVADEYQRWLTKRAGAPEPLGPLR